MYLTSQVAGHSRECSGNIEFDKTETVKVIDNKFDRKVRETLEIQKNDCHISKGGINPDKGKYVSTTFWMPIFNHLNRCGHKHERLGTFETSNI